MAAVTRGGFDAVDGVIFHSDRGSEYTAAALAAVCRAFGVVQSMGRVGSALDNSPAEAFNSTLKVEFVYRHRFRTRTEAALKIHLDHRVLQPDPPPQPRQREVADRLRDRDDRPAKGGRGGPVTRRGRIEDPPHFEGIDNFLLDTTPSFPRDEVSGLTGVARERRSQSKPTVRLWSANGVPRRSAC